jgi:peptidoglycan/LPS O-acetylase OafA/YrhL
MTGSWWPKPRATTVILIASSLSIWLLLAWLDRRDPANGLVLPLFAGIIYACATDRGSLFKTALETTPARFLGRVSYSIYMLHTSVLMVASFAVTLIAPYLKGVSALPNTSISRFLLGDLFCVVYVLGIVASAATFRFVEEPFRQFGNRLSSNLVRSRYST